MLRFATSLVIATALTVAAPASAGPLTVILTDPVGDAGRDAPAYLDMVQAEATRKGQHFEFRTVVAEPIPLALPHLPPGNNQVWWAWGLDTDPATTPQGAPVAPGISIEVEFVLRVSWDGDAFSGALIDRTPLLTGGEAVFTPLPFTITSNQVSMSVPASAVGNPTSFLWDIVTVYWAGPPHSVGFHPVDSFDPFFNLWPS
jgi:hypothetical protein